MKTRAAIFAALCLIGFPAAVRAADTVPDAPSQTVQTAFSNLVHRLTTMWVLDCDAPGARDTVAEIRFQISPTGYLAEEPVWVNRRDDAAWQTTADKAISAIKKAQPYENLPAEMYNRPIKITFDAQKACQVR